MIKENRTFIEFNSKDEYLQAMVEDLSEWLNYLYSLEGDEQLTPDNFFRLLKNGVLLCKHANVIQSLAEDYIKSSGGKGRSLPMKIGNQPLHVPMQPPTFNDIDFSKKLFVYHARDNVSNFISWCKNFNIPQILTFETEDLVGHKNPRNVVVALLEVSRIGQLFGMEVPDIIQLEQDIEDEINEKIYDDNSCDKEIILEKEIMIEVDKDYDTNKDIVKIINGTEAISDIITNFDTSILNQSNMKLIDVNRNVNIKDVKKRVYDSNDQSDNSSVTVTQHSTSLGVSKSFGFKVRRSSANLTNQDLSVNPLLNTLLSEKSISLSMSLKNNDNNNQGSIRKSQSECFIENDSSKGLSLDTSDNDSNFSQSSRSDFKIPKHSTTKPIGRVKIYDHFNNLNYVKTKKVREKIDLRSLDEMVRDVLSKCSCEQMFPMKKVKDGIYQYGDKNTRIFVRILRTHVMVRVGGGWDTLSDFFYKHDPCRKERSDDFKFYLPAYSKKSQSTNVQNHLIVESNGVHNQFDFQQGMIEIKRSPSNSSHECCSEKKSQILKEKNLEIEEKCGEKYFPEIYDETDDGIRGDQSNGESKTIISTITSTPKIIQPLMPQRNLSTFIRITKTPSENVILEPNDTITPLTISHNSEVKKNLSSKIPKSTFQKKK